MRRPKKLVLVLVSLVGAAALVTSAPWTTEAAGAAGGRHIVCQSFQNDLVGGCNRPKTTGGSGIVSSYFGPGPYSISWATVKKFTFTTVSSTTPSPPRCPPTQIEIDYVGKITAVSGHWTGQFRGGRIAFDICLTNELAVSELVPGTVFKITY